MCKSNKYYLLPFRFIDLNNKDEIIVNELGDYLVVPKGTAKRIVDRQINNNEEFYIDLITNFFISEKPLPDLINVLSSRYRTKKSFLETFTSLHIFIITHNCNNSCIYCQAKSKLHKNNSNTMSYHTIKSSIEMMFKSPSNTYTVEFQGGEPLLYFDNIKHAINIIEDTNKEFNKDIRYVICTNLTLLTKEIVELLKNNNVFISTSLDGPEFIHNFNRPNQSFNNYNILIQNINRCKEEVGLDKISALLTVSEFSLDYPKEIVDEYIKQGFQSIFIRALNPYGFSKNYNNDEEYYQRFLEFYKIALLYILDYNLSGYNFVEEYTSILLQKILTSFPTGFTDLQSPNGIINSVLVYNYDGYVYASDESRMLAEDGDYTFRLGHVDRDKYSDIVNGTKAKELSHFWCNETLPGCSECAFIPYCGADPVRNYSSQGDFVGFRPTSTNCFKNMEIMKFIFNLMISEKKYENIFWNWIRH